LFEPESGASARRQALRADYPAAGHLLTGQRVLELDPVMIELDRIAERWYGRAEGQSDRGAEGTEDERISDLRSEI
jgi:hypothetical protein